MNATCCLALSKTGTEGRDFHVPNPGGGRATHLDLRSRVIAFNTGVSFSEVR